MTICSDDHDEIAYEGNGLCPLCDLRDDLTSNIADLEAEKEKGFYDSSRIIESLRKELDRLK